jgi:hypothetical protein
VTSIDVLCYFGQVWVQSSAAEELLQVADSPASGGLVITIFPGSNLQRPPFLIVKVCVATSNVTWPAAGATPPIVRVAPATIPEPVTVRIFVPALFLVKEQLEAVGGVGHDGVGVVTAVVSQLTVTITPCSLP